jgi:hypothetical protein
MEIEKTGLLILSVVVVIVIFCTSAMADGVNQTNAIQGITTSTYIDAIGTVSINDNLAWISGSGSISPPLGGDDAVQTTTYSEYTSAVNGHTIYSKDFSVNTGNQVGSQSNVQSSRIITFEGLNGGRMVSDEELLISTEGNPSSAAGSTMCPFGSSGDSVIPAYCSIIKAGSHVDSEYISLATQASSRTIMAGIDIPVTLRYNINAHGITTANGVVPAQGSVSAYMRVHNQGGSGDSLTKASDFQYQDTSSASGIINSFTKYMTYQSGVSII